MTSLRAGTADRPRDLPASHRIRVLSSAGRTDDADDADAMIGTYGLLASAFLLIMLSLVWGAFLLGIPITRFHLWASVFLLSGTAALQARITGRRKEVLFAALLLLLITVSSVMFAASMIDVSYDGMGYHEVAVLCLMKGWNPIDTPHVRDWLTAASVVKRPLIDTLWRGGIYIDHYPKALWMLGAVVSSAVGSLHASKWLGPYMLALAASVLYGGFVAVGVPRRFAALSAVVGALSPLIVTLLGTSYVDGVMGGALAMLIGASLCWLTSRQRRHLLVLLCGTVLAINLKFTGLVYTVIFLTMTAFLAWRHSWRPEAKDLGVLAAGAAVLFLVSTQTYLHNTLVHGDPFFPVNAADFMKGMARDDFLELGRFEKFFISYFHVPFFPYDKGYGTLLSTPSELFSVPRLWHYGALVREADNAIPAFGPLFIWSFLASLVYVCVHLVRRIRRSSGTVGTYLILSLIACILLSTIINPQFWLNRYVPQLWLVPILASLLLFIEAQPLAGMTMLFPAIVGSALSLIFWTGHTLATQPKIAQQLSAIKQRGQVTILKGWRGDVGVFTFTHYTSTLDTGLVFISDPSACTMAFGPVVRVCNERP